MNGQYSGDLSQTFFFISWRMLMGEELAMGSCAHGPVASSAFVALEMTSNSFLEMSQYLSLLFCFNFCLFAST